MLFDVSDHTRTGISKLMSRCAFANKDIGYYKPYTYFMAAYLFGNVSSHIISSNSTLMKNVQVVSENICQREGPYGAHLFNCGRGPGVKDPKLVIVNTAGSRLSPYLWGAPEEKLIFNM